jgi:hypothetical protein
MRCAEVDHHELTDALPLILSIAGFFSIPLVLISLGIAPAHTLCDFERSAAMPCLDLGSSTQQAVLALATLAGAASSETAYTKDGPSSSGE